MVKTGTHHGPHSQHGLSQAELLLALVTGLAVIGAGLALWTWAGEQWAQRRLVQEYRIIMQTLGDIYWEHDPPPPYARQAARAPHRVRNALPPSLQTAVEQRRVVVRGFARGVAVSMTGLSRGQCVLLVRHAHGDDPRTLDLSHPPGHPAGPPHHARRNPAGPVRSGGAALPPITAPAPAAAVAADCTSAPNNLTWYWYDTS